MTGIEIFLIFAGIIAIVCSFVFSDKFEKIEEKNVKTTITEEMVKEQVVKAVDHILDDKVEETEVKMDKISNEKIMSVGDYSDTVLKEITKNHDEVMFLYGILNDKEKDVKNVVRDVENVKRSIAAIKEDNASNVSDIETEKQNISYDNKIDNKFVIKSENISETYSEKGKNEAEVFSAYDKNIDKIDDESSQENISVNTVDKVKKDITAPSRKNGKKVNNNNKILDLYNSGLSNVEIAKELKIGIGEVRLVIDLYKNRK